MKARWMVFLLPLIALSAGASNIEFIKIEPGEFLMGCSDGDNACNADEKPQHRVRITKAFEIGKFE